MNKPPCFATNFFGRRPKIFVAEICSETSKNEGFGRFLAPRRGKILGSEHFRIKPPPCFATLDNKGGFNTRNSTDNSKNVTEIMERAVHTYLQSESLE